MCLDSFKTRSWSKIIKNSIPSGFSSAGSSPNHILHGERILVLATMEADLEDSVNNVDMDWETWGLITDSESEESCAGSLHRVESNGNLSVTSHNSRVADTQLNFVSSLQGNNHLLLVGGLLGFGKQTPSDNTLAVLKKATDRREYVVRRSERNFEGKPAQKFDGFSLSSDEF